VDAARNSPEACPAPSDGVLNEWGHVVGLQVRDAIEPLLASKDKREERVLEGLQIAKPSVAKSGLYTVRMLADRISAQSCATTVYVPQPWLASRTNQIFNEALGPSEVVVDLARTSCKLSDKRKK
jgi:hypothetical protein